MINQHFKEIEKQVMAAYAVAEEAKSRGLDPVARVEIPIAKTLAEKVVGLISSVYPQVNDVRIVKRILELEKEYGVLDPAVCLKIAEEIAKERFCKFKTHLEAIEAGVRFGVAYTTLGVVSSPIEGFTNIKLKKTKEGKDFFAAYYSGPIRSAGGTAAAFSLVIIDYLRENLGYAKYDPSEEEVKRTVTEIYDYHERITNLQYLPTPEEIEIIARNIPIMITGEPSEEKEASNYKDLGRIETNLIRGGFCLVLAEGLALKAPKILKIVAGLRERGFKLSDWDFLKQFVELQKKRTSKEEKKGVYIQDLVAGRPVFGHPSYSGGFRLRYGRTRTSGYSALAIHPATMAILNGFVAIGTQLKTEKPTKGAVITSCDSIEGPIVKFFNGSVRKLSDFDEAVKGYKNTQEILYLGDILVPYGDFLNRNFPLAPAGYCEEYWKAELDEKGIKTDGEEINLNGALELCRQDLPLHPNYIFYWSQISYNQLAALLDWILHSKFEEKLIFPYNNTEKEKFAIGKRALELLGASHNVVVENVILDKETSIALLVNLGIRHDYLREDTKRVIEKAEKIEDKSNILKIINLVSGIKIRDLAGTFIGARMGRPEKAKLRKLIGSPHVLFPVGEEGGRLRSVQEALNVGSVKADFPNYFCEKCKHETVYLKCELCDSQTRKMGYCPECGQKFLGEKCPGHARGQSYSNKRVDIKHYLESAAKKLGIMRTEIPALIKGVRGTSSGNHIPEHLAKGILRASFNLHVNKDGTIRYDATEIPITHFKAREVGVDIEKLKQLGYNKDIYGKPLENNEQVLEIFPHDIILPSCPDTLDEKAEDVFMNITGFVDSLLTKFYGLKPFYNIKKKEDLVGHLVACIAPHNCACVVGRILGFSKTQGLLASPYMHAAMRRDCFDYDTYLPIKQNNSWKIIKIGELVEKLNPEKGVDSYGTKEKKVDGFETIGVDENLKEVKINNFTKHTKTPLFEIKTSLGKKIKVTENHKFFIEGKVKRASDLKVGDKLPLLKKINIKSKILKEINLLDKLNEENLMIRGVRDIIDKISVEEKERLLNKLKITKKQFNNFDRRDSYPINFVFNLNNDLKEQICSIGKIATKRDSVETPIVIQLSDSLLEVIGLYLAEGYSRSVGGKKGLNQVYIASSEKELRDFISQTIFNHFGLKPTEKKEDRVTFSSRVFYLFFTRILQAGSNARNKRIPYLFLDLELGKLACILRGYFEGDGSAEKNRLKVSCDSISDSLLYDLEFCLARFGIFVKRYEYQKEPGPKVKDFYIRKNRKVPEFKITKLIIGSDFVNDFKRIGFLSKRKKGILESYGNKTPYGMKISYDDKFIYDSIVSISRIEAKESYCLNVDSDNHLVVANSIITKNCDGDEAAVMLLLDMLINFSREYLPIHRGGTQDAPLVLNARMRAGEVDDMIFDLDVSWKYPLEMYLAAEKNKPAYEVKVETLKSRIGGNSEFTNLGFNHDTNDINQGYTCSSYKKLVTMQDKVQKQMELAEKARSVDARDVARLVIERHFIRDIRGNLRKFSTQEFRCVNCNSKYRRPPLQGTCVKCNGKIIFTVSEGSIIKYLEPAIQLAEKYDVPEYLKQSLDLTKKQIEGVFGKDTEKQEALARWF